MDEPGLDRKQMPVVLIERVEIWSNQAPVGISTRDGHIDAAKRIHNSTEAIELDHRRMVNTDTEIIKDRIFKQARSAAGVTNRNAVLVSRIDALVLPFGDEHPQVTRDGDKGYLTLIGAQDGDDHRIGAEGAAGSAIGADQQEVDRLLPVVQDLTTARSGGVNRCQGRKSIGKHVWVDRRGFGLSGRGQSRGWGSGFNGRLTRRGHRLYWEICASRSPG